MEKCIVKNIIKLTALLFHKLAGLCDFCQIFYLSGSNFAAHHFIKRRQFAHINGAKIDKLAQINFLYSVCTFKVSLEKRFAVYLQSQIEKECHHHDEE